MKDLQGRYLFINRRYEELFHVSNHDLNGKTDYEFFPHELAATLQANDLLALASSTPIQIEERTPMKMESMSIF